MSWFGHVNGVTNGRMVKKLNDWKTISTRLAGTPKMIPKNDLKDDLRAMKINNRTNCIQVRVKCKEVAEKVKTFNQ